MRFVKYSRLILQLLTKDHLNKIQSEARTIAFECVVLILKFFCAMLLIILSDLRRVMWLLNCDAFHLTLSFIF